MPAPDIVKATCPLKNNGCEVEKSHVKFPEESKISRPYPLALPALVGLANTYTSMSGVLIKAS